MLGRKIDGWSGAFCLPPTFILVTSVVFTLLPAYHHTPLCYCAVMLSYNISFLLIHALLCGMWSMIAAAQSLQIPPTWKVRLLFPSIVMPVMLIS